MANTWQPRVCSWRHSSRPSPVLPPVTTTFSAILACATSEAARGGSAELVVCYVMSRYTLSGRHLSYELKFWWSNNSRNELHDI